MAFSKFTSVQLVGGGSMTVSGPIGFAADEEGTTEVKALDFAIVQGTECADGTAGVRGGGSWGGTAELADKFVPGPAQGYGMALLVRESEGGKPPVVQTLVWTEPVEIT